MCDQCWNPAFGRRHAITMLAAGAAIPFAGRWPRYPPTTYRGVPVGAAGLEIIPRSAWARGLEPIGDLVAETVQFLLVHHTAGPNEYDVDFVPGHLRGIFEFHTGPEKRWPDVSYNFFIDRFGRVWEGRAGSLSGPVAADATGGSQGFAQLVCLLGDFTSIMPTTEAMASLQRTLAWLADREGLDTSRDATTLFESRGSNLWPTGTLVTTATIAGHRDMSSTACPGDMLYPYVHTELQAAVHALRGSSESPVGSTPTQSSTLGPSTTVDPSSTTTSPGAPASSIGTSTTSPAAMPSAEAASPVAPAQTDTSQTGGPTTASAGNSASPKVGIDAGSSRASAVAAAIGGLAVAAGAVVVVRRSVNSDDEGDTPSP